MVIASFRSFQILDPIQREPNMPICMPINLTIRAGSVTLVAGPNGVGKSSFLNVIKDSRATAMLWSGEISVRPTSKDILHHPQVAMAQFALPLTMAEIYHWSELSSEPHPLLSGLDLSRPWDSSSGGEKQRVILASLLSRPQTGSEELLLLDEPTNHLDRSSRRQVAKEVARWIASAPTRRAAIVVTHELDLFKSEMTCETFEMTGPL